MQGRFWKSPSYKWRKREDKLQGHSWDLSSRLPTACYHFKIKTTVITWMVHRYSHTLKKTGPPTYEVPLWNYKKKKRISPHDLGETGCLLPRGSPYWGKESAWLRVREQPLIDMRPAPGRRETQHMLAVYWNKPWGYTKGTTQRMIIEMAFRNRKPGEWKFSNSHSDKKIQPATLNV